ncbi:hypothetical protein OIU79_027917 [Salix purpurea]|uniref:Uncharacterized protein n=1 Tax=Salix purpurea TaxID=77065 RepID=A0A9Q0VUU2_SALPP|nr:hypothetical protein OIU79_027917 [Salix purpurea]
MILLQICIKIFSRYLFTTAPSTSTSTSPSPSKSTATTTSKSARRHHFQIHRHRHVVFPMHHPYLVHCRITTCEPMNEQVRTITIVIQFFEQGQIPMCISLLYSNSCINSKFTSFFSLLKRNM